MRRIVRRTLIGVSAVLAVAAAAALAVLVFWSPQPLHTCRTVEARVTPVPGAPERLRPMALALLGDVLFVADAERGTVERHASDGTLLSRWAGLGRPVAIAVTPRAVFVADFLGDRIVVLDPDGQALGTWGIAGRGPGEFDAPSGIAIDGAGRVYVTDLYNHRVQVFTPDGRFLQQWGGEGRRNGRLSFPTGIAISSAGEVLVADGFNHRVQRFTADGRFLGKWGGTGYGIPGSRPGWFALAKDIAVGPAGTVYVTDAFNGRLQSFTPQGTLVGVWGDDSDSGRTVRYASGLTVDSDGHAYVGDFHGAAVWKLTCAAGGR